MIRRGLLACLTVLLTSAALLAEDSLGWQPNLDAAKRLAASTNRLVLIHFWSPTCEPCMRLEREVFSQPAVRQAIEARFVPVKLNTQEFPATASLFGVDRIPADVVISPTGQVLGRQKSPLSANAYLVQTMSLGAPAPALAAESPRSAGNAPASSDAPASQPAGYGAAATDFNAQGQTPSARPADGAMTGWQPPAATAVAYTGPSGPAPNDRGPSSPPTQSPARQPAAPSWQSAYSSPAASPPSSPVASAYSAENYSNYLSQNAPPTANHRTDPRSSKLDPGMSAAGSTGHSSDAYGQTAPAKANQLAQPATGGSSATGTAAFAQSTASPATASQPATASLSAPPLGPSAVMIPAAEAPPVGLDGFCPVTLSEQKRWVKADPQWGAVHRGRTYLFAGPQEQQRFMEQPDQFSPVMAGNDPVIAFETGKYLSGRRELGVFHQGRVYLFASSQSLGQFKKSPQRYAAEVLQVERTSGPRTTVR